MFDMMPTDPTILGFGESKWFLQGFQQAQQFKLPDGTKLWAFDALHLLAAKIEAYKDRGKQDWMISQDVEDIITVLDGRSSIFEELMAQTPLVSFIRTWLYSHRACDLNEMCATHIMNDIRGLKLTQQLLLIAPQEANFEGADFSHQDLSGLNFTGCVFKNVNLNDTSFANSNLQHTQFINCKLHNTDFRQTNIEHVTFQQCDLTTIKKHDTP